MRRPPTNSNTSTVLPYFTLNAYTVTNLDESLCLTGTVRCRCGWTCCEYLVRPIYLYCGGTLSMHTYITSV